jgi:hypothetical protein
MKLPGPESANLAMLGRRDRWLPMKLALAFLTTPALIIFFPDKLICERPLVGIPLLLFATFLTVTIAKDSLQRVYFQHTAFMFARVLRANSQTFWPLFAGDPSLWSTSPTSPDAVPDENWEFLTALRWLNCGFSPVVALEYMRLGFASPQEARELQQRMATYWTAVVKQPRHRLLLPVLFRRASAVR